MLDSGSVASIHETARGFCFGSFCFDETFFVIGDGQNRHLNSLHTADSNNPGTDPPVNLARPDESGLLECEPITKAYPIVQ